MRKKLPTEESVQVLEIQNVEEESKRLIEEG
jgi:hypothetical protein